ncbi:hypothetical protein F53441_12725 [Fusarium austroafricanum]|uniref:Uncharacterized protein n=1 Tax=Fusarium austroafricanum TaxID=2364996 RepID=A0A8H4NKR6_9HYPO|nr:hypothetical protein F53441_12725 [Fusarium austroafricanum]
MSETASALEHSERGLDDSGDSDAFIVHDSDGGSGISIPRTPPVPQSTLSQRQPVSPARAILRHPIHAIETFAGAREASGAFTI